MRTGPTAGGFRSALGLRAGLAAGGLRAGLAAGGLRAGLAAGGAFCGSLRLSCSSLAWVKDDVLAGRACRVGLVG